MRFLGIHDGQTSGAAIVEGGRILAAVSEERLARLKHARGFPRQSIDTVLRLTGTAPSDIAVVGVAQRNMSFRPEVAGWKGWFEERDTADDLHSAFFRTASRFAGTAARMPALKGLYYSLRIPHYASRRRAIRDLLRDDFGISAPVQFLDHHLCHAAGAYYASGHDDALVVTMDGGGDGSSSHIYAVRRGEWERLGTVSSYDSLGNYYAYVTALCGFRAKKHEGKITGLAAHGEPLYLDLFERLVDYDSGATVNRGGVLFRGALDRIKADLPSEWKREDLASSIQEVSERLVRRHVQHWIQQTGMSRVAAAGGIFANVRINQEVHELPGVEALSIFPGMADEGLSVGAAYLVEREHAPEPSGSRERLPDVFLGPSFSEAEIEAELRSAGLDFGRPANLADEVAQVLADGAVVARFSGRMEFGPRALGHRSILYQATDPSAQDWLNELLDRTEFMPFAPAVRMEDAEDCFFNMHGAVDTARFMTITFDCTPWLRDSCPAVVHVDGTARPQLVDRTECPGFWSIIEAYKRRTNLPAIINTSFNMHEEPIVCSPRDAVRAFLSADMDYLAIGPFLAAGAVGTAAIRERYGAEAGLKPVP
jgi:carbamoyltransferase